MYILPQLPGLALTRKRRGDQPRARYEARCNQSRSSGKSPRSESNQRAAAYKAATLPTELPGLGAGGRASHPTGAVAPEPSAPVMTS